MLEVIPRKRTHRSIRGPTHLSEGGPAELYELGQDLEDVRVEFLGKE